MNNEVWYLLFGGSSEDGRGPGKYEGRTLNPDIAQAHMVKCRKNPYSTGYVDIVTSTEHRRAYDSDFTS